MQTKAFGASSSSSSSSLLTCTRANITVSRLFIIKHHFIIIIIISSELAWMHVRTHQLLHYAFYHKPIYFLLQMSIYEFFCVVCSCVCTHAVFLHQVLNYYYYYYKACCCCLSDRSSLKDKWDRERHYQTYYFVHNNVHTKKL